MAMNNFLSAFNLIFRLDGVAR